MVHLLFGLQLRCIYFIYLHLLVAGRHIREYVQRLLVLWLQLLIYGYLLVRLVSCGRSRSRR